MPTTVLLARAEQEAYLREFRATLLTPEEKALHKRGSAHRAYHYFGSAKIMGQIGKAFVDAMLSMEKKESINRAGGWKHEDRRSIPAGGSSRMSDSAAGNEG